MVETASGTEGPVLSKIAAISFARRNAAMILPDVDVWELALRVLDEASHGRVFVEPNDDDLRETFDLGEGGERVPDHWLPSHGQKWLRA